MALQYHTLVITPLESSLCIQLLALTDSRVFMHLHPITP